MLGNVGASWWAFLDLESGRVAGAGCIQYLRREAAVPSDLELLRGNPLEIGWRLHTDFWRQGLASEAAVRMCAFAFEELAAQELLAVRHPDNVHSARVMDRLGMRYRGLEPWYGTELATHVLTRGEWRHAQRQCGEKSGAALKRGASGTTPAAADAVQAVREANNRTCRPRP